MSNHRFFETDSINLSRLFELLKLEPETKIVSLEKHPSKDLWLLLISAHDTLSAILWNPISNQFIQKEITEYRAGGTLHFLSAQFILFSIEIHEAILYDYSSTDESLKLNRVKLESKLQLMLTDITQVVTLSFDTTKVVINTERKGEPLLHYIEISRNKDVASATDHFSLPCVDLAKGRNTKPIFTMEEKRTTLQRLFNRRAAGGSILKYFFTKACLLRLSDDKFMMAGSDREGFFIRECSIIGKKIVPDRAFTPIEFRSERGKKCFVDGLNQHYIFIDMAILKQHLMISFFYPGYVIEVQYFVKTKTGQWVMDDNLLKSYDWRLNQKTQNYPIGWVHDILTEPSSFCMIAHLNNGRYRSSSKQTAALFNLHTGHSILSSTRACLDILRLSKPYVASKALYYPSEVKGIYSKGEVLSEQDVKEIQETYITKMQETPGTLHFFPIDILRLISHYVTFFKPPEEKDIPLFDEIPISSERRIIGVQRRNGFSEDSIECYLLKRDNLWVMIEDCS